MIRQCFAFVGTWRRTYILALVMLTFTHIIWTLHPLIIAKVINAIQQGGSNILHEVGFWLCVYALVQCSPWLLWKPARQMERSAAFQMRRIFIDRFYGILQSLPVAWHQDHHSGDTINRVRKAGDGLYQFGQNQFLYIMMVVQVVMAFSVIIYFSPMIGAIALACTVTTGLLLTYFDRRIVPLYKEENEHEHKAVATFFDYISNIKTIISLRLGPRTQAGLLEKIDRIWPPFTRQIRVHENKYMILTICIAILDVSIIGGYIWSQIETKGAVEIGTTVAMYQYLRLLSDSFFIFTSNYQQVIRWKTDFAAVSPISDAGNEHQIVTEASAAVPDWRSLAISGLTFTHRRKEEQGLALASLRDINLDIRRGEKVAIIGASGAGKSTLLAVLRGLYLPDKADVSFDGQKVHNLATLFDQTTLVPQDPEIFENTIRYNITIGLDVDDTEVARAIDLAHFKDVVTRLPHGLDSDIREKGVNLSGGEKQRLALARGILAARNSDIILMDEPTSSVDLLTEGRIYRQILGEFKDATVISSLHRLHLLSLFDRVLVIDQGHLVQDGPFETLVREPGLFRTLWADYQAQQNGATGVEFTGS